MAFKQKIVMLREEGPALFTRCRIQMFVFKKNDGGTHDVKWNVLDDCAVVPFGIHHQRVELGDVMFCEQCAECKARNLSQLNALGKVGHVRRVL